MAIDISTNPTSIFVRLGEIIGALDELNAYRGTTVGTRTTNLDALFASTDQNLAGNLYQYRDSLRSGAGVYAQNLQALAQSIVIQMADEDVHLPSKDLTSALTVLVSQLTGSTFSTPTTKIQKSTSGPSVVVTAGGANVGTGTVVIGFKDVKGQSLENMYGETITVTCTADQYSGGATPHRETFSVKSPVAVTDVLSSLWPGGSNISLSKQSVDATQDNGTNLLANSDFETWPTTNTLSKWAYVVGVAGTDIFKETSNILTGSASLKLLADGSTVINIRQQFGNNSSGNASLLKANTTYAFSVYTKCAGNFAGTLLFSLRDAGGTLLTDDYGNNLQVSRDSNDSVSTWANLTGTFSTPKTLLPGSYLDMRWGTVPANTKIVYVDHMAMTPTSGLYAGGPPLEVFSGATDFVKGDTFKCVITNTRGKVQRGFDRYFDMKGKGLLLPYNATPTSGLDDTSLVV